MNEAVRNPAEPIIEIENLSISFFTSLRGVRCERCLLVQHAIYGWTAS